MRLNSDFFVRKFQTFPLIYHRDTPKHTKGQILATSQTESDS